MLIPPARLIIWWMKLPRPHGNQRLAVQHIQHAPWRRCFDFTSNLGHALPHAPSDFIGSRNFLKHLSKCMNLQQDIFQLFEPRERKEEFSAARVGLQIRTEKISGAQGLIPA